MRENTEDTPPIEEKKEKEIKEQATQLDGTGKKLNCFLCSINEIPYFLT